MTKKIKKSIAFIIIFFVLSIILFSLAEKKANAEVLGTYTRISLWNNEQYLIFNNGGYIDKSEMGDICVTHRGSNFGTFFKKNNSENWQSVNSFNNSLSDNYKCTISNNSEVIAVGKSRQIAGTPNFLGDYLYTNDGGNSWNVNSNIYMGDTNNFTLEISSNGLYGLRGSIFKNNLYRTSDAWDTEIVVNNVPFFSYGNAISKCMNDNFCFVMVSGYDNSKNGIWIKDNQNILSQTLNEIIEFSDMSDNGVYMCVITKNSDGTSKNIRFSDSGINFNNTSYFLNDDFFKSCKVGNNGIMYLYNSDVHSNVVMLDLNNPTAPPVELLTSPNGNKIIDFIEISNQNKYYFIEYDSHLYEFNRMIGPVPPGQDSNTWGNFLTEVKNHTINVNSSKPIYVKKEILLNDDDVIIIKENDDEIINKVVSDFSGHPNFEIIGNEVYKDYIHLFSASSTEAAIKNYKIQIERDNEIVKTYNFKINYVNFDTSVIWDEFSQNQELDAIAPSYNPNGVCTAEEWNSVIDIQIIPDSFISNAVSIKIPKWVKIGCHIKKFFYSTFIPKQEKITELTSSLMDQMKVKAPFSWYYYYKFELEQAQKLSETNERESWVVPIGSINNNEIEMELFNKQKTNELFNYDIIGFLRKLAKYLILIAFALYLIFLPRRVFETKNIDE